MYIEYNIYFTLEEEFSHNIPMEFMNYLVLVVVEQNACFKFLMESILCLLLITLATE